MQNKQSTLTLAGFGNHGAIAALGQKANGDNEASTTKSNIENAQNDDLQPVSFPMLGPTITQFQTEDENVLVENDDKNEPKIVQDCESKNLELIPQQLQ